MELWAFYLATALVVGILVVAVGAAIVVSQRKQVQAAESYAARQMAAMEEERGHVARELHDDVSQQIAILCQRLEALQDRLENGTPGPHVARETAALADGLRGMAATVRSIAHRMHPSALDHLGLGPALQGLAREMASGTPWRIDIRIRPEPLELPQGVALAVYRIGQEALRNVQKHANASRVALSLELAHGGLVLEVSDDGLGLHHDSFSPATGIGLISMRERARLAGGYLSLESLPERGTRVRAWVPISRTERPG